MIGQTVLGGMIFATMGRRPVIQRGWIKRCGPETEWDVKRRNDVPTVDCGFSAISDMERKNGN